MGKPRTVRSTDELRTLRQLLKKTAEQTRARLADLAKHEGVLERLKFEKLGCDPLDPDDSQSVCEPVDQIALRVAVDHLPQARASQARAKPIARPARRGTRTPD